MRQYKMYCIIRKDMPTSYRACQGGHAIAQYFIDHGMHDIWDNGTMIYLKAHDENHLLEIKKDLEKEGIKHSIFTESDMDDQHTALACIDTGERFKEMALL